MERTDSEWAIWFAHDYFGIPRDGSGGITRQQIRQLWEEIGEESYHHPMNALRQEYFHIYLPPVRMVPQFFDEGDALLDFGCGTAEFERQRWIDKGKRTYLIDLPGPNFEYTKTKYREMNIETTAQLRDIPDKQVDRLVCVDVLEHIHNPIETVKELWEKLKDGGQALLAFDTGFPHPGHLEKSIAQEPKYKQWLKAVSVPLSANRNVDWVLKPKKRRFCVF